MIIFQRAIEVMSKDSNHKNFNINMREKDSIKEKSDKFFCYGNFNILTFLCERRKEAAFGKSWLSLLEAMNY